MDEYVTARCSDSVLPKAYVDGAIRVDFDASAGDIVPIVSLTYYKCLVMFNCVSRIFADPHQTAYSTQILKWAGIHKYAFFEIAAREKLVVD